MNRWKVHRTSDEISPWAAIFNGWEDGNLVLRESYHGTWTEAIAHADHMARTIQVTLPPPEAHPSDDVPGPSWHASENLVRPWVSTVGRSVWRTDHRGLGDFIDADSAEQLGLALLAAAEYTKENQ